MSTRKIKDGKVDGEKVYFKGHAQATYMSDGKTVEEAVKNACAYPVVSLTESKVTLKPNTFYFWNAYKDSLDISFESGNPDVVNEYVFGFGIMVGVTPSITLPDTIQWANGEPNFEEGKNYQISIVNNIGLIVSV